jgi:hypothetical protein
LAVSSSQQQISSSQQQISASLLNVVANYATTGSNSFRANQSITGSLVVSSTITAQTLVVQTVTSSIVYSSGSNIFGSALGDRQTFTGSVNITGSLTVNTTGTEFQVTNNGVVMGNLLTDAHSVTGSVNITGSLSGTSARFSMPSGNGALTIANSSLSNKNWTFLPNTNSAESDLLLYYSGASAGTRLTVSSSGAATFSSSVTATSFYAAGQISTTNGVDTDLLITLTTVGAATKYAAIQSSVSGRVLALNPTNGANVGIGTTNPVYTLDVTGTGRFTGILTAQTGILFPTTQTVSSTGSIGYNSTQGLFIYTKTGTSYDFKVYNGVGSTFMQVPTGTQNVEFLGSVTIAASTPGLVLNDTSGAAAGSVVFQNNGTQKFNLTTLSTSNNFVLYNNGGTNSYNLTIAHSTGNVGIGVTDPTYKLQVSGDMYLTGRITTGASIGYTSSQKDIGAGLLVAGSGMAVNQSDDTFYPLISNYNIVAGAGYYNYPAFGFMRPTNNINGDVVISNRGDGLATVYWKFKPNGDFVIPGAISKGSGTFKIDHPLESKKDTNYLIHSFIEGPRADLIYRGTIDLISGSAIIDIDETVGLTEGTFNVLVRETQCFVNNQTGWDLIKGQVSGSILTITSQNENSTDTISWMVVGERHDEHIKGTIWTDENGKPILEPLKNPPPPAPPLSGSIE